MFGYSQSGTSIQTEGTDSILFFNNNVKSAALSNTGSFRLGTIEAFQTTALFQLNSSSQGFLAPRMSATDRGNIVAPATGLLIYNTSTDQFDYYDGSSWLSVFSSATGNDGDWTVSGTNLYSAVSGNVGIGVSTPSEKLEVTGNLLIRNPQNNGALIFSPSNSGYGVDPEFVIQSAETGAGNNTNYHLSRNALYRTSDNSYQYIDDAGVQATKFEYTSGGDMKFSYAAAGTGAITWTDNVIIKGSTGNVGIGTTTITPAEKLDVVGAVQASNGFKISSTSALYKSGTVMVLNNESGNDIAITQAGVSRIRIDGTGNVGIGDASPDGKLEVRQTASADIFNLYDDATNVFTVLDGGNVGIGTTSPNAPLQFSNTFPEKKIVLYEGGNNDHQYYGFGMAPSELQYRTDQFDADHVFYSAINTSSSLELMRIQGDGKVGIGTATPAQQLSIGGINDQGWIYMDPNDEFIIENNQQSNRILLSDGTAGLRFEYSAAEIMRIKNNVGIGTTTASEKLEVVGNIEIPSANDYKYATPKTRYASVHANGFTYKDQSSGAGVYASGGSNSTYILGGFPSVEDYLIAAIQLPHGATITNLTFKVYDADATYNCYGELRYIVGSGGTGTTVATTSSSTSGGAQTITTSGAITEPVVDNSTRLYYLRFVTRQALSSLRLYGAIVEYTVDQAN